MSEAYQTLEALYLENRQRLFTCALSVAGCPEAAEDAIHEVFRRLFQQPRVPGNLKAYVFRAVRNAAIDVVRRRTRDPLPLEESVLAADEDPREDAARAEFRRQADAALQTLSADERETVVQHLYGDLTFREIAEIRRAPLGTITSWYRRGLEKLRERLGE